MPLSQTTSEGTAAASFEAAYRELQQVVERLEEGGLSLEEAVSLFERGSELVRLCQRIVDEAELRVTRLSAEAATPLLDVSPDE